MALLIGNNVQDGGSNNIGTSRCWTWRYLAGVTGNGSKIRVMWHTSNQAFRCGIYSGTSTVAVDLMAYTDQIAASSYSSGVELEYDLNTTVTITSGSYYWLAVHTGGYLQLRDDVATTSYNYDSDTFSDGMPDPFVKTTGGTIGKPYLYIEEDAAAGGIAPRALNHLHKMMNA